MTDGVSPPPPRTVQTAGLVVLAFHRVVTHPERDHDIGWDDLRSVLDGLDASRLTVSLGADPSTFKDLHLALTFDDATEDHFDVALELERREMKGVFFVPPAKLGRPTFLDTAQLRTMDDQGHVIGAHGLNHIRLPELSANDRSREVADSKTTLEDLLRHSVDLFAPPGGAYVPNLPAELARTWLCRGTLHDLGYVPVRQMIAGRYRASRLPRSSSGVVG